MSLTGILGYIDPLSGSILIQLIIAGALGGIAFFHRTIAKVLRVVLRRPAEGAEGEESEDLAE